MQVKTAILAFVLLLYPPFLLFAQEAGIDLSLTKEPRISNRKKETPAPFSRYARLMSSRWSYGNVYKRANLSPVKNPNPDAEPQPIREHPSDLAITPDGEKLYIALKGSELNPGDSVALYHIPSGRIIKRIKLKIANTNGPAGLRPFKLTLHPGGRFLIVNNHFSNFASVIDTWKDRVSSEIPLDFYCEDLTFSKDTTTAYVVNRYLDQVFLIDVNSKGGTLSGGIRELGGMDEEMFFRSTKANGGQSILKILENRCGNCHSEDAPAVVGKTDGDVENAVLVPATDRHYPAKGGFILSKDRVRSFCSVLQHVEPGNSKRSRLLRAVIPARFGGYADILPKLKGHAGGTVVFSVPSSDPDFLSIAKWIDASLPGPGIPVGNPRSKPGCSVLSNDGRYLFVGQTGTSAISIIDTGSNMELGAIYIQSAVNDLKIFHNPATKEDYLIISSTGLGFGVMKERDPFGGESWDRKNPAAHFSVWRDNSSGLVLQKDKQLLLGPYHAVDGTAAIKFRDIQNDLIIIKLSSIRFPTAPPGNNELNYLLFANRYEAHKGWVRYTSDTAESTYGDIKGDIPPDLMRVVGAYPDKMAIVKNRLFVLMQGSMQVQEWKINPDAVDPGNYLIPVTVYKTGLRPTGIAVGSERTPAKGKLFVSNFLGGTLTIIDLEKGESREQAIDPSIKTNPVPASNAEIGEIMAHTGIFSSDGDSSCLHCHLRNTGDGRPWGSSHISGQEFLSQAATTGQIVVGGTLGVPALRGLFKTQPFLYEGVHSAFEQGDMIAEHNPEEDYITAVPGGYDLTWINAHKKLGIIANLHAGMTTDTGFNSDLEARRNSMFRRISMQLFGKAFNFNDFKRFIGEWEISEPRLLPNPFDRKNESALRGQKLFFHAQLSCSLCHNPPDYANKTLSTKKPPTFDSVVTLSRRNGCFTMLGSNRFDLLNNRLRDLEPWDEGRVEHVERQGHTVVFNIRGIWDRPPVFLQSGLATSLREVICTPGQAGLGKYKYMPLLGGAPMRPGRKEVGFNETYWYTEKSKIVTISRQDKAVRAGPDSHGGTSLLREPQVEDLINYLNTIE
ncbi:hypothetical protein ACFL35_03825 [Candidatus Riflebacteria bacterium]